MSCATSLGNEEAPGLRGPFPLIELDPAHVLPSSDGELTAFISGYLALRPLTSGVSKPNPKRFSAPNPTLGRLNRH